MLAPIITYFCHPTASTRCYVILNMKKLLILLPFVALLIASCSNDFDVAAPWKEVPVVYAILSAKDTAQYVRIEKAFLDPQTSALEIAQISDSLYYPAEAISVYLERSSNSSKVLLTRVDGNLEGFPRRSGIFATQPNWLYKVKTPAGQGLAVGEKYRLVIKRADGKADITAETTIPAEFTFTIPNQAQTPPLINFLNTQATTISWRSDANAVYFNGTFTIRYREEAPNGTVLAHKSITWRAFTNQKNTGIPTGNMGQISGKAEVLAEDFFRVLADSIPKAVNNDRYRYFEPSDLTLEGGGKEIDKYLSTASIASGITSAESIPTYTNISEGYGIFTAKNTSILKNIKIETKTVDSMNDNILTVGLNFRY